MSIVQKPEVWQRGPVNGVPHLLQPVAHALLQAQEEIHGLMEGVDESLLWLTPAGLACPAFHIQHITGVLDRLFTYARGEVLTEEQLFALSLEGKKAENIHSADLLRNLDVQIGKSVFQLQETQENILLDVRAIGRKKIPTNVVGLLFHAAEHTMRHTGQLLVTVKVLNTGMRA